MADRATIRTGFPQEEFGGGRFTRAPDPRFGGNMARANEGAQYRGSPRYEHGAYLKGSPMHDAQYGNYVAPHRVDYTRNAPPQSSGTPNFRPPYGAPGQPSYGEWMQQIDPFHTGTYPPKKHPNPRMRHINPRGMGGGLGGLQVAYSPGDFSGPIRRPRIKPLTIEEEELDLLDILEGLDPGDELDPDEYYSDGWDVADTGIGSTNEYQMAELRPEQIEHMQASDPANTFLTRQELFQQIKDMEDKGSKGFLGFGVRDPQEPTTWDEFNEKYDWLEGGGSPYGSEPHTKSYWTT